MVHPIEVVPMVSREDYFKRLAVVIGLEGVNVRTDPDERHAGLDLLVNMGVLQIKDGVLQ